MSDERSYRGEFLKSPHHAWFGLLTLGSGFLSAQPLLFLAGLTAYAIGWVYLPDLPLFRGWVNRREAEAHRQVEQAKVNQFLRRRDAILSSLAQDRLQRYQTLADVCQNIETASAESATASEPEADPRLRKLDELMWTYLRLLSIEESLENFVATEEREKLPTLVQQAEGEIAQLHAEHKKIEAETGGKIPESKHRFLVSREERLEVLRKRLERAQQARENLALVLAEQDRLAQQIKLIRADAVASRNAGALTARIDATVEHLGQTNRWLAEMDEFKDLVGDLPETDLRLGFASTMPPPLPESPRARGRGRVRQ